LAMAPKRAVYYHAPQSLASNLLVSHVGQEVRLGSQQRILRA